MIMIEPKPTTVEGFSGKLCRVKREFMCARGVHATNRYFKVGDLVLVITPLIAHGEFQSFLDYDGTVWRGYFYKDAQSWQSLLEVVA